MNRKMILAIAFAITTIGAKAQNREGLIGCWTMQNNHGTESLSLNRDGQFVFNDWNRRRGAFETLTGRWTLNRGNTVSLLYDDRSKQSFAMSRNRSGQWMLTKAGGFILFKGDPSECSAR